MKKLNDNIWDKSNKLIPEVKERLLLISKKVLNEISDIVKVKHIYFTGSLATYHWTPISDIDLHIIVDILDDNCDEPLSDYLDLIAKLFNNQHNIFIKGHKVELGIREFENFLKNKAVYDLIEDDWVKVPTQPTRDISDPEVIKIAKHYQERIDDLIKTKGNIDEAKFLKRVIKSLRTSGLETEDGEYSVGNLTFKLLRNTGYIGKLFTYYNDEEDKNLSLESIHFKSFFNTSL
jgi:predicted nucleotidyltransferase